MRLIAASLTAAAAIGGGLAVQMAHGHDPALGPGASSAQAASSGGASGGQSGSSQDKAASPSASVVTRSS